MVTKIFDFIHKHLKCKVVESFCNYLHRLSKNSAKTKPNNFTDRKSQNHFFFFQFFITKSPNFISNLIDDFFQLSFEVYNICVAQKLQISEFLIDFFFAWNLAYSAASLGHNFNLSKLNKVLN